MGCFRGSGWAVSENAPTGEEVGVKGRADPNAELLDAEGLVGHLVDPGSVYAFLAELVIGSSWRSCSWIFRMRPRASSNRACTRGVLRYAI